MNRSILSYFLILIVGFGSLLQLSAYVHSNRESFPQNFIRLIPPPLEALAASFGTPIVTTDIGLFAYYEAADWDLNDVIPAFHNYTQYSNYVDGYVRVWSDVHGTTFEGDEYHDPDNDRYGYIDVSVRVRSDGWILAWINEDQNKGLICIWGDHVLQIAEFEAFLPYDTYNTCLSRAIHRVYHNAGVSWVGYDEIFYYDYEYPDATRLCIFGDQVDCVTGYGPYTDHYYFTIPDTVTIEEAYLCGAGWSDDTYGVWLDDVLKIEMYPSYGKGWLAVDISSSISIGTRHDVKIDCYANEAHTSSYILLWTS